VTAIIRPERLGEVSEALGRLELVGGFTVSDVRGNGRSSTTTRCYRGIPYVIRLACELKIEVVVPEDRVNEVMESIQQSARTGSVGDGKIWVTNVATVVRIRTGERGLAAL
jgi:nitrogen regulatory protein PII